MAMTDPYPAIRKQVEALERAAHDFRYRLLLARIDGAEEDTPESCPTLDRARAALNRRVEETCKAIAHKIDNVPDMVVDRIVTSLLNEEPDDD